MNGSSQIDLIEIARTGSIGPVRIGAGLFSFASVLGTPNDWSGYSSDSSMSCVMRFGSVELGLRVDRGDLRVNYAKIPLFEFKSGKLNFGERKKGKIAKIANSFSEQFPTFLEVEERIKNSGLVYSADVVQPLKDSTAAVMRFGPVYFFFGHFKGAVRLEVVELF